MNDEPWLYMDGAQGCAAHVVTCTVCSCSPTVSMHARQHLVLAAADTDSSSCPQAAGLTHAYAGQSSCWQSAFANTTLVALLCMHISSHCPDCVVLCKRCFALLMLPWSATEAPESINPWYASYQAEFLRLLKFTDHDTLDHPVAGGGAVWVFDTIQVASYCWQWHRHAPLMLARNSAQHHKWQQGMLHTLLTSCLPHYFPHEPASIPATPLPAGLFCMPADTTSPLQVAEKLMQPDQQLPLMASDSMAPLRDHAIARHFVLVQDATCMDDGR